MRLRHFLLLVFLLVALGPLLLFRAWPHSDVLQGELDEVHERHLLLARNLAAALERYHRDLVTTFDLFAASQDRWTYTPSTKRVLDNLHFVHLCLADKSTGQVVQALAPVNAPCPDVFPPERLSEFNSLTTSGEVSFGHVVEGKNGQNVMHLVTERDNKLVIGAIDTTYFRQLGEAISFGVMGHAAIVDQTGRALSHPLPDWVAIRKDMSKISAVQKMMQRMTGVEIFYSPALKGDMIAGYTFVDPVGWGVMIPQPIAELYEKAEKAELSSLAVLAIGTVSALLLAYIVALRVVRPLEEVSRASTAIATGSSMMLPPPKETWFLPVELRDLQVRFHEMVDRLRENLTTINALAYVDALTGLANRTVLQECLSTAIKAQNDGALLLVDLDGFKGINDVHGHDAGDEVLKEVAKRLSTIVGTNRLSETQLGEIGQGKVFDGARIQIARMGGDEFAIWLPGFDREMAQSLAQDIVDGVSKPITVFGESAAVGASVGSALFPEDAVDRPGLTKAADLALYDAKNSGKNQNVHFTPALRQAMDAKYQFAAELKEGLEKQQFVPFFQPQFELKTGKLLGVEGLARWRHPRQGLLLPESFIPIAEETGVLETIDKVIFQTSMKQMLDLDRIGLKVGSLALNVSSERLISPNFHAALDQLPALPFELRFELVETMILDQIEGRLAWSLDRIREDGHKLDLDDFGSANASVLGLMNVSPAHLKIDKKLVQGLEIEGVAERLVSSIIDMAHSLDVPVIAEGVEAPELLDRLVQMHCDFVQGFVLAGPMPAADLELFLRAYHDQDANGLYQPTDRNLQKFQNG